MASPGDRISSLPGVGIRRMAASDGPAAREILMESPEASIWSLQSLLESISQGFSWMAEVNGAVAGILVGRVAADEFEILNLAVAKAFRRRQIATQIVSAALEGARALGANRTFLEARASNQGGIAFYERIGFRILGRRPNYYRDPVEDALVLVLHNERK